MEHFTERRQRFPGKTSYTWRRSGKSELKIQELVLLSDPLHSEEVVGKVAVGLAQGDGQALDVTDQPAFKSL